MSTTTAEPTEQSLAPAGPSRGARDGDGWRLSGPMVALAVAHAEAADRLRDLAALLNVAWRVGRNRKGS